MTMQAEPRPARRRLDAFEAVFQVAQLTVRRSLQGWRPFVALAVVLLPAALSALVRTKASPANQEEFFYGILSTYHFGVAVPFVSLVFATAFPWPESDEGTLTYWFTSPIPRWTVLLGRWLAAALVGGATLCIGALSTGVLLDTPPAADTPGLLRAAVAATLLAYPAYLALFQVVATVFRHGLVFGIVFIILENVVALLSGTIVRLTLIFYVRSHVWPSVPAGSRQVAEDLLRVDEPASTTAALLVFGGVTAAGLLVSLLAVSVIEYRGRTSQQG